MYLVELENIEEGLKEDREYLERCYSDIKEAKGEIKVSTSNKKSNPLELPIEPFTEADIPSIKKEIELVKNNIKEAEKEKAKLEEFVDDYTRLQERYKRDKKTLRQIKEDWEDYNMSLFSTWSTLQAKLVDKNAYSNDEMRQMYKSERLKRDEIELRFKRLLT